MREVMPPGGIAHGGISGIEDFIRRPKNAGLAAGFGRAFHELEAPSHGQRRVGAVLREAAEQHGITGVLRAQAGKEGGRKFFLGRPQAAPRRMAHIFGREDENLERALAAEFRDQHGLHRFGTGFGLRAARGGNQREEGDAAELGREPRRQPVSVRDLILRPTDMLAAGDLLPGLIQTFAARQQRADGQRPARRLLQILVMQVTRRGQGIRLGFQQQQLNPARDVTELLQVRVERVAAGG